MSDPTPRWELRFANFGSQLTLLEEAVLEHRARGLNDLEQAGLINRFQLTWELAWKVMAEYLAANGQRPDVVTAAAVTRSAFAANLITDGDCWMEAMKPYP